MPSIATATLSDGQATPVAHTFGVVTGQNGASPATWQDRSPGVIAGFKTLTLSVNRAKQSKSWRVEMRLTDPTLAVTAPASGSGIQPNPTVAYNCLFVGTFILPEACSLQNRKDILAYVKDAIDDGMLTAAVQDLEPSY